VAMDVKMFLDLASRLVERRSQRTEDAAAMVMALLAKAPSTVTAVVSMVGGMITPPRARVFVLMTIQRFNCRLLRQRLPESVWILLA
jgi:hypothetical protein